MSPSTSTRNLINYLHQYICRFRCMTCACKSMRKPNNLNSLWSYVLESYISLLWHHNERNCVSNHQRLDYLINRMFRRKQKKYQTFASLAFVRETTGDIHFFISQFSPLLFDQQCHNRWRMLSGFRLSVTVFLRSNPLLCKLHTLIIPAVAECTFSLLRRICVIKSRIYHLF